MPIALPVENRSIHLRGFDTGIARSILERGFDKAVILTDGWAGMKPENRHRSASGCLGRGLRRRLTLCQSGHILLSMNAVEKSLIWLTWRIVYRVDPDAVIIAVLFKKKTQATPQRVIDVSRMRLREYDHA